MQEQQMQGGYQPPMATPQQPKKKTSVGKIIGIGCLVVFIICIIIGALLWWGGKKALNMGIEMTMKDMKTDVLANYEKGSTEYDAVKYEMDMLVMLSKQKKIGLLDFASISEKYDQLKADGEIDRKDSEILVGMAEDFNETHSFVQ